MTQAGELGLIAEVAMTTAEPRLFRAQVLDLLGRSIGFDKASMHCFRSGISGETYACGYERPEAFDDLPQLMSEFEPEELAAASEGRPIVDVEALPARRRDRLSLYPRILWPEKVSVYMTAVWRAEQAVAGVTLARTGRGAWFTPGETAKLEGLLPAIRLGDALVSARQREAQVPSFEAWACHAGLSVREREVAALVVRGLANGEVAALLRVSANTVRNHLASVFRKASVSTRAELVFAATTFAPALGDAAPRWMRYLR